MILAITNQKGGVGKTTTVLNIGVYLAVKGKKVLLIDIDPQANLTSGLGVNTDEEQKGKVKVKTIYDFLVNQEKLASIIQETRLENLQIAPSGIELAGAEVELVSSLSRESILKRGLEKIAQEYDYVLIDCPPSLGLLTINGLVAAEQVLIPVQAEYFALEGLGQLINTIKLIKNNLNPKLEIGGVILTMFDNRTNLSKDVGNEIESYFQDKLFKSVIPRSVRLSEAPSRGLSIFEYSPQSPGGVAYEKLAREIIRRFSLTDAKMIRPNFNKSA